MHSLEMLVILMALALLLVAFALKFRFPYPLALVVGGAFLGFVPGVSDIAFDPELLLVIVLPPILYYAAYSIQIQEVRRNISDILWLALGLVLVTTAVIGLLFKGLFPDLPWPLAFVFGALISPPDAVAATSILRRFATGSRLVTILEGESLINDATGLVLYRIALAALLSGVFSWTGASLEFVKVAIGGIAVGAVTGYALHTFTSRFFDPVLAVVSSFLIPYLAYLAADALQVSGVLAVVVNGLIGARMLMTQFSALTRVIGWASWDIFIILLNCFVFILIGIQLHEVVERLTMEKALIYIGYAFLITLAMGLVRFIWVFAIKGMGCFTLDYDCKPRNQLVNEALIISWAGMRGIVSLTLALALPFNTPGRDIVIFMTFFIIFFSLLIPGLTLGKLLEWLKMSYSTGAINTSEIRKELISTAQEELKRLLNKGNLTDEEHAFLLNYFQARHQVLELTAASHPGSNKLETMRLKVLNRKRERLLELWQGNEIGDELFTLLERELDLEEAHHARAIL